MRAQQLLSLAFAAFRWPFAGVSLAFRCVSTVPIAQCFSAFLVTDAALLRSHTSLKPAGRKCGLAGAFLRQRAVSSLMERCCDRRGTLTADLSGNEGKGRHTASLRPVRG